ncbi:hypothetical protein, partial [Escherichia coli]|uniref:hypothetical protein n=1 Tax=Escherichia coli TaxID=562 RepID=UPI003CE592F4
MEEVNRVVYIGLEHSGVLSQQKHTEVGGSDNSLLRCALLKLVKDNNIGWNVEGDSLLSNGSTEDGHPLCEDVLNVLETLL